MVKNVLQEPLFWFFLIGSAIFLMEGMWSHDDAAYRINITKDDVARIRSQWAIQTSEPLSEQALSALIDEHVREEIHYREALRLGLDRHDVIIRRRLIQKLQFLFEDISEREHPTDSELRQFFANHKAQYVLPARISFSHIFFNPERRRGDLRREMQTTMTRLNDRQRDKRLAATEWASSGDPFMLRHTYTDLTQSDIAHLFGATFAAALFQIKTVQLWQGPIRSGYGEHLVQVERFTADRLMSFAEARERVLKDFLNIWRKQSNQDFMKQIERKYQVEIKY